MTCHASLIVTALAFLLFIALGSYLKYRQIKKIADEQNQDTK